VPELLQRPHFVRSDTVRVDKAASSIAGLRVIPNTKNECIVLCESNVLCCVRVMHCVV
jgi:hypothetical protein